MENNQFLKWLPSIFILIGVGFWLYSLCFSVVTNDYEKGLVEDWTRQIEINNSILDASNIQLHFSAKLAIRKYRNNESEFSAINQIMALKDKTIKQLDECLVRSDTNSYSIIMAFKEEKKAILSLFFENNRHINKERLEGLLSQQSFSRAAWLGNTALFIKNEKGQIHLTTYSNLNFLASQISSGCFFFRKYAPTIKFKSNVLKKGKLTENEALLLQDPLERTIITTHPRYIINGKDGKVINEVAAFKHTSKNSIENISVECEATRTYFKQENLITDTIAIKENFTIYSID
jgi:hypothetical protein